MCKCSFARLTTATVCLAGICHSALLLPFFWLAEIKAEAPDTLQLMDDAPGRLVRELLDARDAAAAALVAAERSWR